MSNKLLAGILFVASILLTFTFVTEQNTVYTLPNYAYFPAYPSNDFNPLTREGVELGRYLFYDKILSGNNNFSCASCHQQANAFSDSPIAFSVGENGDTLSRNTMPLFNLAWYDAFFWDGRASTIEEQVFHPVRAHNEMNLDWEAATTRISGSPFYNKLFYKAFGKQDIDSVLIAKAIAQFERSLVSGNSKYDSVLRGKADFTHMEYQGFVLVNDQSMADCFHCHVTDGGALGTTGKFSNNGIDNFSLVQEYPDKGLGAVLDDSTKYGHFKIPSLRNLSFTAPYMHDGRFKTLEEVLDFYSEGVNQTVNIDGKMQYAHQGGVRLTEDEKQKIVAFLRTMDDYEFVSNKQYSDPFRLKH